MSRLNKIAFLTIEIFRLTNKAFFYFIFFLFYAKKNVNSNGGRNLRKCLLYTQIRNLIRLKKKLNRIMKNTSNHSSVLKKTSDQSTKKKRWIKFLERRKVSSHLKDKCCLPFLNLFWTQMTNSVLLDRKMNEPKKSGNLHF